MAAPALPPDFVLSSGPLILGYMLNWGLFGVVPIQVFFYYIAFPRDSWICKCLVYGVYTLEVLQTVIITHDAFTSFGLGFGNFETLDNIPFTRLSIPIISGIAGCVVQVFYAYRINVLSQTRVLGFAIAMISGVGCIGAIATGIKCFELGSLSNLSIRAVYISGGIWWGCCALCDVTIAVSMTYLLSRHDTGFRQTHALVTRLTRLTIETGTTTALMAIVNLGLFFGYPHTNFYTVPILLIAKLYSNTLLVLFNSRMRIIGGRDESALATRSESGLPLGLGSSLQDQGPIFARPSSAYLNDLKITSNTGVTGQ